MHDQLAAELRLGRQVSQPFDREMILRYCAGTTHTSDFTSYESIEDSTLLF